MKKIVLLIPLLLISLQANSWEKHPVWEKLTSHDWNENDKLAKKDGSASSLMSTGNGYGNAVKELLYAFSSLPRDSKMKILLEQCDDLSMKESNENYKNMRVLVFCVRRAMSGL